MNIEPVPGFSALKFKEETQARVQEELEGLSPAERLLRIRESAEKGPLGDWWKQLCDLKRAGARAALESDEFEDAA